MGQSAGGTIALALALKIKASGQPQKISGVVALGPATVAPSVVPAHLKHLFKPEENTDSAIIDAEAMSVYTGLCFLSLSLLCVALRCVALPLFDFRLFGFLLFTTPLPPPFLPKKRILSLPTTT
jgi:acetyl esterase/lipase